MFLTMKKKLVLQKMHFAFCLVLLATLGCAVAFAEPAVEEEHLLEKTTPLATTQAWPTDMRLQYKVTGHYRGNLYGNAVLRFASKSQTAYSSDLNVDLGFNSITMHSHGGLSSNGIFPRVYNEKIQGERRKVENNGKQIQFFIQDIQTPTPNGVLDTLSQFWAMQRNAQRGKWKLQVGNGYQVWLMRPEGLFLWSYTVAAKEQVNVLGKGNVTAYRIKPVALGKGKTSADMWLAPSMNYIPVRIKLTLENGAYVDLQLEQS